MLFFELHIFLCVHTSEEFRGIEVDWGSDNLNFLFFFLTTELFFFIAALLFFCPTEAPLKFLFSVATVVNLFLTFFVSLVIIFLSWVILFLSWVILVVAASSFFVVKFFFAVLIAIFKSIEVPDERFGLILGRNNLLNVSVLEELHLL